MEAETTHEQRNVEVGSTTSGKQWTLRAEVDRNSVGYCMDLGVFADGQIIAVDTNDNRLLTLSPAGQILRVLDAEVDDLLEEVTSVAVSKGDRLCVLDNASEVKTLDRDGSLIGRFTPLEESGGIASCIAAGSDGEIAVADETNNAIAIFKPDGSLTQTIPADMIGDYLTIDAEKTLLYTNFSAKKLLAVNRRGDRVIAVDTVGEDGEPIFPSGVACHADGDIYISAQTSLDMECGEIHHYDPQGRYKGRVVQGLSNPFAIAFSPSGELLIAEGTSVKIFHQE